MLERPVNLDHLHIHLSSPQEEQLQPSWTFVGAASEGKRWPRVRFFPYVQIWSKCHTYNQAAELQVGLGMWQALGPEPGLRFGIWYHLLQWSGSYTLPSKCWALCIAFKVSQTATQFQRKLLVIKVSGHIFLREHAKCMTQVPSSSAAALKISAAAPASPACVGVGMPLCSPAERQF